MKALVTGGGGFLGRRITELLLERGDEVTILARNPYPEVLALGAKGLIGDLRDPEHVRQAVRGHDAVFHVAALAAPWAPKELFRAINVDGTRHVIDAMEGEGVPRLIYTSTPSVVASGEPVINGPMDMPHAENNDSAYGSTKAEAEAMVSRANSRHLATVSLRPRLIIGPREPNILPRLLERAQARRLPCVGDGNNLADLTYIDNAAYAHLDALAALEDHESPCAGKAYFISNGEPVNLWEWVQVFLEANGVRPSRISIPVRHARSMARGVEWMWRHLPMPGEPPLTRQVVTAMGTTQTFDMEPARRDLGYEPRVDMDEATQATIQWFIEGRATVTYRDGTEVCTED